MIVLDTVAAGLAIGALFSDHQTVQTILISMEVFVLITGAIDQYFSNKSKVDDIEEQRVYENGFNVPEVMYLDTFAAIIIGSMALSIIGTHIIFRATQNDRWYIASSALSILAPVIGPIISSTTSARFDAERRIIQQRRWRALRQHVQNI